MIYSEIVVSTTNETCCPFCYKYVFVNSVMHCFQKAPLKEFNCLLSKQLLYCTYMFCLRKCSFYFLLVVNHMLKFKLECSFLMLG